MKWPPELENEYIEFNENKTCNRASKLIDLLFETEMPPCYFAGDLTRVKYGLLGLNPGYGKGRKEEFEAFVDHGWEHLYLNFFNIFHHELGLTSNYYNQFAILLSGVLDEKPDLRIGDRYTLLHENLVNFDLIPYHSKRFKVNFLEKKMDLIKPHLDITKELIKKSSVEYLFFNGKTWEKFLKGDTPILENTIKESDSFEINPGNKLVISVHYGECLGRKMVWFDKFLNARGSGMSHELLYETGQKIRQYYGIK